MYSIARQSGGKAAAPPPSARTDRGLPEVLEEGHARVELVALQHGPLAWGGEIERCQPGGSFGSAFKTRAEHSK